MTYDFHPAAQQELNDTIDYYDQINPDLGDAFLDELDRTLERIKQFPEAWSLLSANTRCCRMNRFPYSIIYSSFRCYGVHFDPPKSPLKRGTFLFPPF